MTAILTAIEECVLGAIGTTETVPVGTFTRGVYQPSDERGDAVNAFLQSRTEVEVQGPRDTGLVPRSSNVAALEYEFVIRCSFTAGFELDDDGRRSARATAISGTELARAALTRPQNLRQTSAAVSTGLVGGCLIKASSKVKTENHKKRLIVTEIAAKGLVQTSRP